MDLICWDSFRELEEVRKYLHRLLRRLRARTRETGDVPLADGR